MQAKRIANATTPKKNIAVSHMMNLQTGLRPYLPLPAPGQYNLRRGAVAALKLHILPCTRRATTEWMPQVIAGQAFADFEPV